MLIAVPIGVSVSAGVTSQFSWSDYLDATNSTAASVGNFRHCAMSEIWDSVDIGVKVEVKHIDSSLDAPVYWIATIVNIAGRLTLLYCLFI